jgi:hypothetical protein
MLIQDQQSPISTQQSHISFTGEERDEESDE